MTDFKRGYDDSWFFTPEWQAKEREADASIEAGRYMTFGTAETSALYLRRKFELQAEGMDRDAARKQAADELRADGHEIEIGPGFDLNPA